jgi:starch synthase
MEVSMFDNKPLQHNNPKQSDVRAESGNPSPRTILSSFGRLFLYQAARELIKRGALDQLYTADLKSPDPEVGRFTTRFPLVFSLVSYAAFRAKILPGLPPLVWNEYDAWVSRHLNKCRQRGANVFHGWSAFCLTSLQQAKSLGMLTVVDRSCPHILTQKRILEEELDLLGIHEQLDDRDYFRQTSRMIDEYTQADYIITCSEYSRRSFLEHGFAPDRVIKIPLGTNFAPQRVERSPKSPFRVLCVGTHPYRKGVVYLIRAWNKLKLPGAELVIRAPLVPKVAAMLNDPGIKVLPPLSRDRLAEEYRRATVFCLPSIDDGFGMVVLEAMAYGLPVIVSTHVGASEIMIHGVHGLVFPVRDVDALADCLVTLYRDREKALWMGENALKLAQEYTWERYADQLIQFYKSALSQTSQC